MYIFVVVIVGATRGRGRARGSCAKHAETPKPGKSGYTGSTTSTPSWVAQENLSSFHDDIPASARLQCAEQDVLWVNNKGDKKPQQVLGEKVLLRQQPVAPPVQPEILLLTDQMLAQYQSNDKYIKCCAMIRYSLKDFTNDIKEAMLQIDYKYIVVFLGTMQIAEYEHHRVAKQVHEFMTVVSQITPQTLVLFSGLIPRPLDHPRSRRVCINYSSTYNLVAEELRRKRSWNCVAMTVFEEFCDRQGAIVLVKDRFLDTLTLTQAGIRVLRAAWLRKLGYFPRKASELGQENGMNI